jgi:phytoene desaturase
MKIAKYQYEIAVNDFLPIQYNKVSDFLSWRMMTEGRKLHVFENMDKYIKRFFKHPKIKQILEYNLVFLGSSPFNTPALYNIMSYVDFGLGVWYPMGGLFELTKALVRQAEKFGAKIIANTPVSKILVENGKSVGVEVVGGGVFEADIVISNADYAFTERKLLAKKDRMYSDKYWDKRVLAPSAFMMYLGLNKRFPSLQGLERKFCRYF